MNPARPRSKRDLAAPVIIAAGPILALRAQLRKLTGGRKSLTPGDPVVQALNAVESMLSAAITEAMDVCQWYDLATAAAVLSCSTGHLAELCRSKRIEARKIGGDWRVSRRAVEGVEEG